MGRKRVDPGDDTVQIAVRLPARQVEELERRYEGRASSRSAAVRLAVAEVIAGGGPPLLGVHRDNPAETAPSPVPLALRPAGTPDGRRVVAGRVSPEAFRRIDPARKGKR
jgi:hypothetical protein